MAKRLLLAASVLMPSIGFSQNQDPSGMKASVSVDIVGDYNAKKDSGASDKLQPRGAEVMFYGPIDPMFDGVLSFAAHPEEGEALFEAHEAYLGSDRLIPMSRFRIGQFFLGVGRLNQTHTHEWPFISSPIVQERFFGPEGVLDSGVEYSILLPLPFYLDLTVGATNGFNYGHDEAESEKPKKMTHYARVVNFFESEFMDVQSGLSFLAREAADGTDMTLVGWDLTGKQRARDILKLLWQSEVWLRKLKPEGAKSEDTLGLYLYPQYGFDSRVQFGVRYDYLTVTTLKDASGKAVKNHESAIIPTIGYKPSEFSTVRLGYSFKETDNSEEKTKGQIVETQVTFLLGAHPTHKF
jgi:hypothetical protein